MHVSHQRTSHRLPRFDSLQRQGQTTSYGSLYEPNKVTPHPLILIITRIIAVTVILANQIFFHVSALWKKIFSYFQRFERAKQTSKNFCIYIT